LNENRIFFDRFRSSIFPDSGKRLFTQGRPSVHDEPTPMLEDLPRLWENDAKTDHFNPLRVLWGLFEGGFG
jgi:hypothetical protein